MSSPFIPGTLIQYAWDNTSLTWFMDCPRKYFYAMIEGWAGKGDSVHLTFGGEYHKALEAYDHLRALGNDHEQALTLVVFALHQRTAGWTTDHKTKNRDTLFRSVIWYLEEFKDDTAQTLILANGKPAVELSFKVPLANFRLGDHQVIWAGHLDRVVLFGGDTFIMDRKTTSMSLGPYYFEGYDLDRQMTGYTFMGKVGLQTAIKGVIIDAAQVQVGGTNFARGLTYRTEEFLEEWMDTTFYWISQAAERAGNYVSHIEPDEHFWPKNETSCSKYRSNDPTAQSHGCVFRGVCSKAPSIRRRWLEGEFTRREWNPLVAR